MQHDDAVRQFAHHVHLVFHQQDGLGLVGLEAADQVQDHRRFVHAHAGRGFVEHEHLRLQRHENAHLQLALIAMRQAGSQCITSIRQRHRFQHLVGLLGEVAPVAPDAPQIQARTRLGLHRQPHVFPHCEVGKQVGQLESAPQTGLRSCRCAQGRDVPAAQHHAAGMGLDLPGDQIEISGLARAVGAHDGGERAGLKSTGHAVDRHMAAEAHGQVLGG